MVFAEPILRRPLSWLAPRLKSPTAPCYHLVSDSPPAHVRHLYVPRRLQEFESELDYLLSHFRFVALAELLTWAKEGRSVPSKTVFLSFDDGLREAKEIVAPVLLRKGVPAT